MAFAGDPVAQLDSALKRGSNAVEYIPGVSELERVFDSIGLGKGSFAPVARAGFTFAVVAGVQHLVKPSYAYDEQGNVRPWRYGPGELAHMLDEETGEQLPSNATSFPWFALPSAAGLAVGLFV